MIRLIRTNSLRRIHRAHTGAVIKIAAKSTVVPFCRDKVLTKAETRTKNPYSLSVQGRQPVTNSWRERVWCSRAEGSSLLHSGGVGHQPAGTTIGT